MSDPQGASERRSFLRITRRLILSLAMRLGVGSLMRRFHRRRLVILMYHGFKPDDDTAWEHDPENNHVTAGAFERQVRYLVARHSVTSLETFLAARAAGAPLPPHPVIITMDDGYRSNFTIALPILRKYSAPAAIFVTTQFVDERLPLWPDRLAFAFSQAQDAYYGSVTGTPVLLDLRPESCRSTLHAVIRSLKDVPQEERDATVERIVRAVQAPEPAPRRLPATFEPLTWAQIAELRATHLVEIGNHTHTHRILGKCRPETQREEITTAHDLLSRHLGEVPRHFCYPNGGPDDFDATTIGLLKAMGYVSALTTVRGHNLAGTDMFHLRRVAITSRGTFDDFLTVLYGGWRQLITDLLRLGRRV